MSTYENRCAGIVLSALEARGPATSQELLAHSIAAGETVFGEAVVMADIRCGLRWLRTGDHVAATDATPGPTSMGKRPHRSGRDADTVYSLRKGAT